MLVLGGGGYTMRNVARCWTYETGVLLGQQLQDELPFNDYFDYYGPDYRLHIASSNMENKNDSAYLESITKQIFEQLDGLEAVPGVPMQKAAPPAAVIAKKTDEHIDPDKRAPDSSKEDPRELMPESEGAKDLKQQVNKEMQVVDPTAESGCGHAGH